MKVRVLSDLHTEFAPFADTPTEADVVVLAGDIGTGTAGLHWAAQAFGATPVVYVAGNHEYYGHEFATLRERLRKTARELGIHFLENSSVVLDGVRFLGATLWTDFQVFGPAEEWFAMHAAREGMSDCRVIRDGDTSFGPTRMAALHEASRGWLERELRSGFSGPTVVVTHHLPSLRSVAPRFARSLLTAAFASRRDDLVAQADLWVHGHTHDACDYRLGRCRVVCNPRGYPGERPGGFEAAKVVTVGRRRTEDPFDTLDTLESD